VVAQGRVLIGATYFKGAMDNRVSAHLQGWLA
jgi:hypothetical protein